MPLIIVEGVDGSGKTTLIQNFRQVASRLCWLLFRSGPPQGTEDLVDTVRYIERSSLFSVPLIVDRHPLISETIYGPIVRGKSLIEDYWTRDRALQRVVDTAVRVIHCRPPMEDIEKLARREKQMPGVLDNLWILYQAYDQTMASLARSGATVVTYDWTRDDFTDLNHLFLGSIP